VLLAELEAAYDQGRSRMDAALVELASRSDPRENS
jgi:hypothetical protein